MPSPPLRSRADVLTDAPDRYAKQLVAHLSRTITFVTEGTTSTATVGDATAQITVGDGVLRMLATGGDEPSVARVQEVLGGHLERFGQRRQFTVTWTPATAAPASSTDDNSTAASGTHPFSPEESA